jgi:hypothetical protein
VAEISRKLEAPYIVVLFGELLDYGIALVPASVINQKQFEVPVLSFTLLVYGFEEMRQNGCGIIYRHDDRDQV